MKFKLLAVFLFALIALSSTQAQARWLQAQQGRFIQRDPIGYRGGINLYGYVESNPNVWGDAYGMAPSMCPKAPCGKFIIREKKNIPVAPEQQIAAGGNSFLDGFDVEFDPSGCDVCCDSSSYRVSQAIESDSGRGQSPHIDVVSKKKKNSHSKTKGGIPIPGYTEGGGRKGDHGKYSHKDAPYGEVMLYGEMTFTIEVCALCKKTSGEDCVLGCVSFTFGSDTRKPIVSGGTKHKSEAGRTDKSSSSPAEGGTWEEAVSDWESKAGK